MKVLFMLLFLCISFLGFSQHKYSENIEKLEDFILKQNKDSINFYLNDLKNKDYGATLKTLVESNFKSLSANKKFLEKASLRYTNNYEVITNYIKANIKIPNDKRINTDYVHILWNHMTYLVRDRFVADANKTYVKLGEYINQFDDNDIDVVKSKLRLKTHDLQIKIIKKDANNGKELAYKYIKEAKELKDAELEVIFTIPLLAFFVAENDVESYIKTSEPILKVAKTLENKSYYFDLLSRLVNAYIYKGGYESRCLNLLDSLFQNPETRKLTYIYYVQFIHTNIDNKELLAKVLSKFNTNSVLEFVNYIKPKGKKELLDIDYMSFLDQAAKALFLAKEYNVAFNLKNESLDLSREVYTNQLSETLADFKTEQAVKVKEAELNSQKEKNKIYIGLTVLVVGFLIVVLLINRKIKNQAQQLKEQNNIISKTLKEKELLVKEVHHRVKNNFQIVSSLLELQSKGIEDEKALALANEGKNRVKSMALIHQKLYQNETGLVDFDEYLGLLVKELNALYASGFTINTSISSENMKFDVDTAIPLGLIINEIITNSYKYAFKANQENKLQIAINRNSEQDFKLIIEDNGPGIPKNLEVKKAKSLGLRLVNRLVKQLHGTLEVISEKGTRFEILFKDENARQLVN